MAASKLRPVQKTPLASDFDRDVAIRELQQRVNELVQTVNILLEKADGTGLSV